VVHDIIGDILDWDDAHAVYLAADGATGERYSQRLKTAERMAEIEARWQQLPGGFHDERKRSKLHIQAVADAAPSMSSEELCWLAIAAASAWIPRDPHHNDRAFMAPGDLGQAANAVVMRPA
jgi:hypothetical protein